MSDWRLLAELPAFDPSVPLPEVLRPLVLGNRRVVARMILLDPIIPPGHNWLNVCEVTEGEHRRFMSWISDTRPAVNRLYVPAPSGSTGFPAESPLYEGHWRSSVDEPSELPRPKPEPEWSERAAFLAALDRVEATAARIVYRGISMCRLCGQRNGHEALRLARWEWPAGFRHYLSEHNVRPSTEFEGFISITSSPS